MTTKPIEKDNPNYIPFDTSPLKRWAFNQLVKRDEEQRPIPAYNPSHVIAYIDMHLGGAGLSTQELREMLKHYSHVRPDLFYVSEQELMQ